jgi:hypothetical protein
MEYVALKTFLGKYGQMHRGMVYTLPDGYGNDLMRNGLVRRKAHPAAPQNTAHEGAPAQMGEGTVAQQDDGKGPLSSASLPARPSRRRTPTTSNLGPGATAPRK